MITHRDGTGARPVRTMTNGTAKTAYFDQLSQPVLTVGVYKDITACINHYDLDGMIRISIGVKVDGEAAAQYIDRPTSDDVESNG